MTMEKGDMSSDTVSLPPNYAASETYTDSPPPAYKTARGDNTVKVVRMVCLTVLALSAMVGFFALTAAWLSARPSTTTTTTHLEPQEIRGPTFVPRTEALFGHKGEHVKPVEDNHVEEEQQQTLKEEVKVPDQAVEALVEEVGRLETAENEVVREKQVLSDSITQEMDEITKNIKPALDMILGDQALAGRNMNCKVEKRQQDMGNGIMTEAVIVTCDDEDKDEDNTEEEDTNHQMVMDEEPQSPNELHLQPIMMSQPPSPPMSFLAPIMKMLAARANKARMEQVRMETPNPVFFRPGGPRPFVQGHGMVPQPGSFMHIMPQVAFINGPMVPQSGPLLERRMMPYQGKFMANPIPFMNGQMNNGLIFRGPVSDELRFNGPMMNGPMNNGPMMNGPLNNGPMMNGPMINGPMGNQLNFNGPPNERLVAHGRLLNAPTNNEATVNEGNFEEPINDEGIMHIRPVANGPIFREEVMNGRPMSHSRMINQFIPFGGRPFEEPREEPTNTQQEEPTMMGFNGQQGPGGPHQNMFNNREENNNENNMTPSRFFGGPFNQRQINVEPMITTQIIRVPLVSQQMNTQPNMNEQIMNQQQMNQQQMNQQQMNQPQRNMHNFPIMVEQKGTEPRDDLQSSEVPFEEMPKPQVIPFPFNPATLRMGNPRITRLLPIHRIDNQDQIMRIPLQGTPMFFPMPQAQNQMQMPFQQEEDRSKPHELPEQEEPIVPEAQGRALVSPINLPGLPGLRLLPGRMINLSPPPFMSERQENPRPVSNIFEARQIIDLRNQGEFQPQPEKERPDIEQQPQGQQQQREERRRPITHMESRMEPLRPLVQIQPLVEFRPQQQQQQQQQQQEERRPRPEERKIEIHSFEPARPGQFGPPRLSTLIQNLFRRHSEITDNKDGPPRFLFNNIEGPSNVITPSPARPSNLVPIPPQLTLNPPRFTINPPQFPQIPPQLIQTPPQLIPNHPNSAPAPTQFTSIPSDSTARPSQLILTSSKSVPDTPQFGLTPPESTSTSPPQFTSTDGESESRQFPLPRFAPEGRSAVGPLLTADPDAELLSPAETQEEARNHHLLFLN